MTPPWAFMDGMGLAHRRAVGAGHARPGGSRGGGRRFPTRRGRRPYAGGCPLTGCCANLRRGWAPRPTDGIHVSTADGSSVGRGLTLRGRLWMAWACPPPRGRGRACPAGGFFRGWAVTGGFRGVGDAAPYVGGCPLTGSRANLRRGAGTPPYGWNSRKRADGHSLMGRREGS